MRNHEDVRPGVAPAPSSLFRTPHSALRVWYNRRGEAAGTMTARGDRQAAGRRLWRLQPEDEWRRNLYVVMVATFASFTGFTFVMPFLALCIKELGVTDPGLPALW